MTQFEKKLKGLNCIDNVCVSQRITSIRNLSSEGEVVWLMLATKSPDMVQDNFL